MLVGTSAISAQIVDKSRLKGKQPIKVACVGNSITYGFGIDRRDSLSYPAQLARLLGEKWEVQNFGVTSRTMLKKGDLPYMNELAYADAKSFLPDVVLIKFGTNETKPCNWKYQDDFISDYRDLIRSFQELESKPIVVVMKPVPVFPKHERWGINDSCIVCCINPKIDQLVEEFNIPVIDLHAALDGQGNLFPDKVHPNAEGAAIIAKTVYEALVGNKKSCRSLSRKRCD